MNGLFGSLMSLPFLLLGQFLWCTPGWWLFMKLIQRFGQYHVTQHCFSHMLFNLLNPSRLTGEWWIHYSSSHSTFQWTCEWQWNLSSWERWWLLNIYRELGGSWYLETTVWLFLSRWSSYPGNHCLSIYIHSHKLLAHW